MTAETSEFRRTLIVLLVAVRAAFAFLPFLFHLGVFLVAGRGTRRRIRAAMAAREVVPFAESKDSPAAAGTVYVVAGEDSGDLHAANLVAAIHERAPGVRVSGMGGPRMAGAGAELEFDLVRMNVMGVLPVLRAVGTFFRLFRDLLRRFETDPPDVFVPVDYPGFNLRAARLARSRGIPVVAYIAPQVWAWAPWRLRRLRRSVDRFLVILPFESDVFQAAGVPAPFVGHPLFEHLDATVPAGDRPGGRPVKQVGLLPGSRTAEVRSLLPWMLDAAARLAGAHADLQFVLPYQRENLRPVIEEILAASPGSPEVRLVAGATHETMRDLDVALVASGTATLELAYYRVPMVVLYRVGRVAALLKRFALIVPDIALVNIVAGRRIVPEFVKAGNPAGAVAGEVTALIRDPAARTRVLADLELVRRSRHGAGVSRRAAGHVLAAISRRAPGASSESRP